MQEVDAEVSLFEDSVTSSDTINSRSIKFNLVFQNEKKADIWQVSADGGCSSYANKNISHFNNQKLYRQNIPKPTDLVSEYRSRSVFKEFGIRSIPLKDKLFNLKDHVYHSNGNFDSCYEKHSTFVITSIPLSLEQVCSSREKLSRTGNDNAKRLVKAGSIETTCSPMQKSRPFRIMDIVRNVKKASSPTQVRKPLINDTLNYTKALNLKEYCTPIQYKSRRVTIKFKQLDLPLNENTESSIQCVQHRVVC